MRMKRYVAPDMRQALQRVRAEQGPDAVILSTRRLASGVEVCAAIDYEIEAATESLEPYPAERPDPTVEFDAAGSVRGGGVDDEIRSLRELLETQVAALAWNDFARREPHKARVLEDLTNLGLSRDLALDLLSELPAGGDAAGDRRPLALLARRIAAAPHDLPDEGRVLALVGPHGAGKSTTLAKLAARHVLEHGNTGLALVSMDRDRFGSSEQLQALGRVLGVPSFVVEDAAALAQLLARLGPQERVFVDTGGVAPRSERLVQELLPLADVPGLDIALVLPASAQAGVLDETVARYAVLRPAECILTRLDEAASLGGAISALIRSKLPVSWLCSGPRVPDDIEPARPNQLVARALGLARRSGAAADEDLLARRFGGHIHAAA